MSDIHNLSNRPYTHQLLLKIYKNSELYCDFVCITCCTLIQSGFIITMDNYDLPTLGRL